MSKILGLLHEFAENENDVLQSDDFTYEISLKKRYLPELVKRMGDCGYIVEHLILGNNSDTMCTGLFTKFTGKNKIDFL